MEFRYPHSSRVAWTPFALRCFYQWLAWPREAPQSHMDDKSAYRSSASRGPEIGLWEITSVVSVDWARLAGCDGLPIRMPAARICTRNTCGSG
jgi:hypothetical protein